MLDPNQRLNEYDTVTVRGKKGTILIVHDADPPAYEVELFDEHNDHLWWGLIRQDEIESVG